MARFLDAVVTASESAAGRGRGKFERALGLQSAVLRFARYADDAESVDGGRAKQVAQAVEDEAAGGGKGGKGGGGKGMDFEFTMTGNLHKKGRGRRGWKQPWRERFVELRADGLIACVSRATPPSLLLSISREREWSAPRLAHKKANVVVAVVRVVWRLSPPSSLPVAPPPLRPDDGRAWPARLPRTTTRLTCYHAAMPACMPPCRHAAPAAMPHAAICMLSGTTRSGRSAAWRRTTRRPSRSPVRAAPRSRPTS